MINEVYWFAHTSQKMCSKIRKRDFTAPPKKKFSLAATITTDNHHAIYDIIIYYTQIITNNLITTDYIQYGNQSFLCYTHPWVLRELFRDELAFSHPATVGATGEGATARKESAHPSFTHTDMECPAAQAKNLIAVRTTKTKTETRERQSGMNHFPFQHTIFQKRLFCLLTLQRVRQLS